MKAPLLEADHELNLARAWHEHQDEDALHELTSAYMRLVIAMAAKFRVYGLPMGDLVQEGNVGLMQAAQRFDPERGVRFSTYASWWIRSSIQDYILRNWSIVRTGTTAAQKSLFFNLRRLRALINDGGRASMTPEGRDFIADKLLGSGRAFRYGTWKPWNPACQHRTVHLTQRCRVRRAAKAPPWNGRICSRMTVRTRRIRLAKPMTPKCAAAGWRARLRH